MKIKNILQSTLPQPLLEQFYEFKYFGLPMPFRTVRPHTLLSNVNLFFLQELARRVENNGLPGDFVECGVYRGGSAGVLAYEVMRSKHQRRLWLYDSFAGMPAASDLDDVYSKSIEGQFVGSEAQTRRIMERLKIPNEQFEIVVGLIEDTLPQTPKFPIALLHIDCDFYNPVKMVLETFYDRVSPGGYVVLNDYGSFQGCREATDEFIRVRGLDRAINLIQIDRDAYFFQTPVAENDRTGGSSN
jgi:O-methyltransferase